MKFLFSTLSVLVFSIFCYGEKETLILGEIKATVSVVKNNSPSLQVFLEAMPTHFIHHLNTTGKYVVYDIKEIVSQSNLNLELEYSEIFIKAEQQQISNPKYLLKCDVVEFLEKVTQIKNPLDNSIRLNRDIYVSMTMRLTNRENPSDQKTFQVPPFNESWDEDLFGTTNQTNFESRKKVDEFAKASAHKMSLHFMKEIEQVVYLHGKNGNQCFILAGYENGVEVGQEYDVFISKQIIHPITKKKMSGGELTKIGSLRVTQTQSDVSTCEILEDNGINTDVSPEQLPVAKLTTN